MFMLGRASGRHLHALAHNRDPRPVQVGRRRGSIGSQHALGRRTRGRGMPSTPSWSGSSTASPAGCGPPGASAGRSSCGCASTTSRARRGRTRCRGRPPHTQTILATVALAAGRGDAADRAAGRHARRDCGRQSRGRSRRSARLAVRPPERDCASTLRSTRCASASVRPPSPERCCSAASCVRRCRSSPTGRASRPYGTQPGIS